jgi:fumarate reductase subunit D
VVFTANSAPQAPPRADARRQKLWVLATSGIQASAIIFPVMLQLHAVTLSSPVYSAFYRHRL